MFVLIPAILNPPNCPNWKSKIVTALTVYLANVKDMSNYGSAMTAAAIELVPVSHMRDFVCVCVGIVSLLPILISLAFYV